MQIDEANTRVNRAWLTPRFERPPPVYVIAHYPAQARQWFLRAHRDKPRTLLYYLYRPEQFHGLYGRKVYVLPSARLLPHYAELMHLLRCNRAFIEHY